VSAQVYTGTASSGGTVVLSNFPSAETPVLLIAPPPVPIAPQQLPARSNAETDAPHPIALKLPPAPAHTLQVIADVAQQLSIAPELLHAVIAAESRYDSSALSPKGAMGLMQLMPATARRFGARDPFVIRQNVLAGASYLKWLMALFENDLELVLAAYNAGEQAVIRAGRRIPPYPETQAYVPRVLAYLRCASSATCKPA
jgi:soluble lytic murein transglycosylase-like protein